MWQWLDGQLINWDSEILKKIPNGELAEQIFELWKPLLDTITDNLDKITKLDIKKILTTHFVAPLTKILLTNPVRSIFYV